MSWAIVFCLSVLSQLSSRQLSGGGVGEQTRSPPPSPHAVLLALMVPARHCCPAAFPCLDTEEPLLSRDEGGWAEAQPAALPSSRVADGQLAGCQGPSSPQQPPFPDIYGGDAQLWEAHFRGIGRAYRALGKEDDFAIRVLTEDFTLPFPFAWPPGPDPARGPLFYDPRDRAGFDFLLRGPGAQPPALLQPLHATAQAACKDGSSSSLSPGAGLGGSLPGSSPPWLRASPDWHGLWPAGPRAGRLMALRERQQISACQPWQNPSELGLWDCHPNTCSATCRLWLSGFLPCA
ncbi:hypothetical protein TREES_T100015325 [Tupaia chinensis]|uniref:Uncharacterized protein n=1 Tax=Tupaia chinensis TaxID=246437 RepID=L9KL31_TUPCH|nr:hypothetical protein TREES_T100015325 [Tupaia chinensis]